jgi:hypothetical protein
MPSVQSALQAAGLAQIESTPTVDLPIVRDDRAVSRAAFDVRFGVLAVEVEAATDSMGTIGSIEVTSNAFKNVDGTDTVEQTDETITEP